MLRTLVLLLAAAVAAGAQNKPILDGLDAFVEQAMKDFKVPGVAIAVIRNDEVILSKGYGLRDVKQKLPVTPKTLFAIGSSTKSFTVASLGTLVDDGKLDWDKPVREYLPSFRLFDQVATERMTPRDLVTHRSGLPRHDLIWYSTPFSREEIFERLRYLEPSRDFRSTWQYQNLMFMTAGYLAGHVAQMPWEKLVQRRIFDPLGMKNSNFSVEDSKKSDDFALPYSKVKEEVTEVPFRNIDQIGPAGSINSNLEDMVHYVRMQLSKGKFGGKQVVSEGNITQMQSPQMVIPGEVRFTEVGHQSYGMGLFVTTYRGHKLVHHGGNIDGFSALVTFLPDDKVGMVILTNMSGSPVPGLLSYNVYDRLLGLGAIEWTARIQDMAKKAKASEEDAKKRGLTSQRAGTHPSHEFKEYTGDYEHPGYGVLKITLEGDHLALKINALAGPLHHFHYDVFEVAEDELNPLSKAKIQFHSNLQGDIDHVSVPIETTVKEIEFKKLADRSMSVRAFLEPFAGDYVLGPTPIKVALRGENTLTVTLPGQPTYELVGVSGTKFNIKGLTGFAVEFRKDEMLFTQPDGTFAAKRK